MKGIITWSVFARWFITKQCLYMSSITHMKWLVDANSTVVGRFRLLSVQYLDSYCTRTLFLVSPCVNSDPVIVVNWFGGWTSVPWVDWNSWNKTRLVLNGLQDAEQERSPCRYCLVPILADPGGVAGRSSGAWAGCFTAGLASTSIF